MCRQRTTNKGAKNLMTITEKEFNAFKDYDKSNRVLEGISYFAWLNTPKHDEKYDYDAYEIVLALSPEEQAKAESYGLEVRSANKWVAFPHVEIIRKVRPMKGQTAESVKPKVVDSMQVEVPKDLIIGNGSEVIVKFHTFFHSGKVRTTLNKVQIRKLVAYIKPEGLVKDETGFQVSELKTGTDDLPF
jgi:hypothetical protein